MTQLANRPLATLITEVTGSEAWLKDLTKLKALESHLADANFRQRWMAIKHENKVRLAAYIKETLNIDVDPTAMFDVQIKRIHEYKRQFMNILWCVLRMHDISYDRFSVIERYERLKTMSDADLKNCVPRVVIFGGKVRNGGRRSRIHVIGCSRILCR